MCKYKIYLIRGFAAFFIIVLIIAATYQYTKHKYTKDSSTATAANDNQKNLALQKKLAEQGDVEAQFNLGVMYYNGDGIAKDYAEALKCFKLAAKKGHAAAQKMLSSLGH